MGALQRMMAWSARTRRCKVAAEQIYQALLRSPSGKLEVSHTLSTDDDVVQSVLWLRKLHPNVTAMHQSRGLVLALDAAVKRKNHQAWKILEDNNYFPDRELSATRLVEERVGFMRWHGGAEDPKVVSEGIAKADSEKRAIRTEVHT